MPFFGQGFQNRKREFEAVALRALAAPLAVILGQNRGRQITSRLIGEEFCYVRTIDAGRGPEREGFIELPAGCSWAKSPHGGCTFCSFQQAVDGYTGGGTVSEREFVSLFKAGHSLVRGAKEISIFTGGSFWDGLPEGVRRVFFADLARDKALEQLNVESRPEYITEKNILAAIAGLNYKRLRVAIGLETLDDELRNNALNKGMSRKSFESAVGLLKKLHCRVAVYVLLKPHYSLSESAAIDEAVRTISYLSDLGADVVLLQAMMVIQDSESYRWYRDYGFRPPWLWSVIEVIRATGNAIPVKLAVFNDSPRPLLIPTNCERCSDKVNHRLDTYRQTLNVSSLDNLPGCSCRAKWQSEL